MPHRSGWIHWPAIWLFWVWTIVMLSQSDAAAYGEYAEEGSSVGGFGA